ncbi:MAG: hypothetical protein HQM15_00270 [Deltaproteobacteria bacterium]|nr:hypothetical protein [Deltaproteobacteria bacterium]
MRKIIYQISILVFFSSSLYAKSNLQAGFQGQAPLNQNIYLVVKGVFASQSQAAETKKFIQQLLVRTPADGIIASDDLKDFPKGKWVVASAFDDEKKAKWWLSFSDRNAKLPRPYVKKTQISQNAQALPYFPEAERLGEKRFASEQEILNQIEAFSDVRSLKKEAKIKYQFTKYPRSEDMRYEVEILKEKNGRFISYDFVKVDAENPKRYSRFLEKLK